MPEDDYEYACMKVRQHDGAEMAQNLVWEAKEDAAADVKAMSGRSTYYDYKLVKRRKAGPIEEVKDEG